MAGWTTMLNALFLVGKPITSSQGLALRDNPIAIAEGAAGAPRISNRAHPEFGAGIVVLDFVTPLGLDIPIGYNAGGGGSGTDFGYYWSFTAMRSGSLRITANIKVSAGSQTARIAIFRNTTLLAESTSSSTGDETKLFDFIFDEGDQITVRGGLDFTSAGGTAYINTLTVKGDRRGVYRA
jgi:hypothetical protein